MRRPAYVGFLAAYLAAVALHAAIAIALVAILHIFCSASRLVDAGFRYGRSLLVIGTVNFVPPIVVWWWGIQYVDQNSDATAPYAVVAVVLWSLAAFFASQVFVSIFCLRYPSFPREQGPMQQFAPDGRRLWVDTANEPRF
ncbi:hypothetical protein [Xanthobacter autotrophicus]|uniref:hypothetical protein n=1 Tax=Xanthobacter autotrophicus TaxID=280 RepID=UPI0037266C90